MPLKQITKIRDFGIFTKFDWSAVMQSFSLFNLGYGWNYSGKTTLSRILRSFETGVKHPDYSTSTFEIEHADGSKHSETHLPNKLPIRVFNTDFIAENLKWNENADEFEPILLLGQQNIQLQQLLDDEKLNLNTAQQLLQQQIADKKAAEERISSALTNRAREIKSILTLTTFDKRHFEPDVVDAAAIPTPILLSSSEVDKLLATYKSTDKKDNISSISVTVPNISDLQKSADELLEATVKSKIIERLKNSPELNIWVKKGRELHQGKTTCEFCGNELPTDLLENLANHFSKDYDNLIDNLDTQIRKNNSFKINLTLLDAANFYSEFQQEFLKLKSSLTTEVDLLNTAIKKINSEIEGKKSKVFEKLKSAAVGDNSKTVTNQLLEINKLIERQNQKTLDFEKEKSEACEKLIANYALDFAVTHGCQASQKKIVDLQAEIEKSNGALISIEQKIIDIEQQLSETVKGAEKINEYLNRYFGKEDIKVVVTDDKKFQLIRAKKIAKNLSEGEKTAIAFAYFITRLEDKNTVLADAIVYIDDPISSLDSNHLFNTYSFIKDKFYFYDAQEKKHKCKAKQFFISTHNFEFFNLIKDWFKGIKEKDKSFYLVERITNTTKDEAIIKTLPFELLKFKSEYVYLFFLIHSFKANPTTDFNHLYNLPNIVRRFIETFTAFKYLSTRNIDENIDLLIEDPVNCERVRKFVHYHSHSLSTTKLIQFSDPTECSAVIDILLAAIETTDEAHYKSLIGEVTSLTGGTTTAIAI